VRLYAAVEPKGLVVGDVNLEGLVLLAIGISPKRSKAARAGAEEARTLTVPEKKPPESGEHGFENSAWTTVCDCQN
jgi:hypothetical protein